MDSFSLSLDLFAQCNVADWFHIGRFLRLTFRSFIIDAGDAAKDGQNDGPLPTTDVYVQVEMLVKIQSCRFARMIILWYGFSLLQHSPGFIEQIETDQSLRRWQTC